MRLTNRLRKVEAAFPRCDGRGLRLAGPDHVPTEGDRCPRCGRCHVLVIDEVVVEAAGPDLDIPRAGGA